MQRVKHLAMEPRILKMLKRLMQRQQKTQPLRKNLLLKSPYNKKQPNLHQPAEEDGHGGGHSGQSTVEEMWNQSSGPVRIVLGTLLFMLVAAMGVGLERPLRWAVLVHNLVNLPGSWNSTER